MADCTGSEVKVLLYIARRTFGTVKGRKNGSDAIALSQICNGIVKLDGTILDRGTGLAKQAAIEALRRLEFAKIVERERGNGRTPDTWRIAAALPSVKVKAPDKRRQKRCENHTASGVKIIPLTGMKITPAAVCKSHPQKKGLNHHQKEREKESPVGEVFGTPEAAENPKPKPFFSQVDDEKPKPKPRTPLENPEREFEARIMERHGTTVDADRLLQIVMSELDCGPLSELLAEDSKTTTAPGNIRNPGAYYRDLARSVLRRKQVAKLEFMFRPEEKFVPSCTSCNDGLLPDGAYCDCGVGAFRRQFDDHAKKTAASLPEAVSEQATA
jgi:hypothetical protein